MIAIPLNLNRYRILKGFDSQNYSYYTLPVTPTGFNIKYNASKLFVTSGRGEFVNKEGKKREWNIWQASNIAELLLTIVQDLKEMKVNPKSIYKFVPIPSQIQNPLDEHIFSSFKKKIEEGKIPLFYTSKGKWRERGNTYRNWDGLQEVLPEDSGRYLISLDLKSFDETFQSYGIDPLDAEDFVDYLQEKYGTSAFDNDKSEEPDVIRKIFEYLGKRRRINSSVVERLRKICILLTEEGVLRSHEYKVYLPTDHKMPLINKGDVIHHRTYGTKTSNTFLKKLGITRMNLEHLILGSFLPRVTEYKAGQKFEFIWYLIKRKRDVLRKRKIVQKLKEKIKDIVLLANSNESDDSVFFRNGELKATFGDSLNYISPLYEQRGKRTRIRWRDFLRKIGIRDYPNPDRIISLVREMDSVGYNSENVEKSRIILNFLDNQWKKFYSKQGEEIKELRNYSWVPTDKQSYDYPTNVYIIEKLQKIVGTSVNFLAIVSPKSKGLIKTLGLLSRARIDDVIKFLLERRGEKQGLKDKTVAFRVYSFLNREVDSLSEQQLELLTENRTIWFKGSLWKPRKLHTKDYKSEFGPNGWIRGYIKRNRLSKLEKLCQHLGMNRPIENAEEYSNWLCDASDKLSEKEILKVWHIRLIRNAYSKLARRVNDISSAQIEKLGCRRVLLTTESQLKSPKECYIIRKSEDVILERVIKSNIRAQIVKPENAELEKLFLKLGSNEAAYSISSKRIDKSETRLDENLTDRFRHMLPWLDGFEYSITEEVTDYSLFFQKVKVYRVRKLIVQYSLEGKGDELKGIPIEDFCCFEKGDEAIYLDEQIQLEQATSEQLHLLSVILTKNLNQKIDKVRWILVIPSLLFYGKIIGISPYDRESQTPKMVQEWVPEAVRIKSNVLGIESYESVTPDELEANMILESEGFEVIQEPTSKSDIDTLLSETKITNKQSRSIMDLNQIASSIKRKHIPAVRTTPSIIWRKESKVIAAKNWKPLLVDGEEVYLEKGLSLPPVEKVRRFRALITKIVKAMEFNPETVNICVARVETDGYNQNGQLFFNASRNDSPYYWFGVVARELAYNWSHLHYPHVKAMIALLAKGLENIDTIFPELQRRENSNSSYISPSSF